MTLAQAPRFWSCGPDSFFGWAADLAREGHVFIRRNGRMPCHRPSRFRNC